MDFGALMQMMNMQQPVSVGQPLGSMPGGLTVDPAANANFGGQSPFAMFGSALQQNNKDQPGLPPLSGPMQRSGYGMGLIQQLLASMGQHNMLGRLGQ